MEDPNKSTTGAGDPVVAEAQKFEGSGSATNAAPADAGSAKQPAHQAMGAGDPMRAEVEKFESGAGASPAGGAQAPAAATAAPGGGAPTPQKASVGLNSTGADPHHKETFQEKMSHAAHAVGSSIEHAAESVKHSAESAMEGIKHKLHGDDKQKPADTSAPPPAK